MERVVEVEQVSFEEDNAEISLRPSSWDDYIGQEKIKKNLKVFIEASKKRGEALDRITSYNVCYTKLLRYGSKSKPYRMRKITTYHCRY